MDLLKLINDKCSYFSDTSAIQGLKSVILHIEMAERHFEIGKKEDDDRFFTDAIYRSNQAYEGSLKEAYQMLTGNKPNKMTPHEIEQSFQKDLIIKGRVLTLFENYRRDWRNTSTHDYTLCFSEQEAFLAIVNVCAFFNILLDQMIERKAYNQEKIKLSESGAITQKQVQHKSLIEQISSLLTDFPNYALNKTVSDSTLKYFHNEMIGMLAAYIDSSDPEIEVTTEYSITTEKRRLYADMLVRKGESSLLIEIKAATRNIADLLSAGQNQLSLYMDAADLKDGILYILPKESGSTKMVTRKVEIIRANESKQIVEIFPEGLFT
ncbi:MAG: hypothetical protein PHQ15_05355 [Methanosarcina sp.]|jgi:hypothetical protein|nr:hypothetical protein [Methanosarcina sp.]